MGEAWSDWYAKDLLTREGFEVDDAGDGDVDMGTYTDGVPHTAADRGARLPGRRRRGCLPGRRRRRRRHGARHRHRRLHLRRLRRRRRRRRGARRRRDLGADPVGPARGAGRPGGRRGGRLRPRRAAGHRRDAAVARRADVPRHAQRDPRRRRGGQRRRQHRADLGRVRRPRHGLLRGRGRRRRRRRRPRTSRSRRPPAARRGRSPARSPTATSGLPVQGQRVGIAGHTSETGFGEDFVDTTGSDGTYEITGVPAGTYPKLAFFPAAGFDQVVNEDVTVPAGGTTVQDAVVRRDWAAASGGAEIDSNDDEGAPFGCGHDQLIDQNLGVAGRRSRPTRRRARATRTSACRRRRRSSCPRRSTSPRSGWIPASPAATTRRRRRRHYRVETSADGVNFAVAKEDAVHARRRRPAEHGHAGRERQRA